jgi:serpin B
MTKWIAAVAAVAVLAGCGSGGASSGVAQAALARAPGTPAAAEAGAQSVDAFGFDLLGRLLAADSGNVAVSPWSVATALAMVAGGARGETQAQMLRVLHADDLASLDQDVDSLSLQLAARNSTGVRLDTANRAYVQTGLPIESTFLDRLAQDYGAGVGLVDFEHATESAREAINAWVAAQTDQRITELIGQGALTPDARLVLANAVYLDATWSSPFAKSATQPAPFAAPGGSVSVPFMHQTVTLAYAAGAGWQAIELPYGGSGQLEMTIVLPDPGDYRQVLAGLSAAMLDRIDQGAPADVEIALPRFDISTAADLSGDLAAMGMPLAFTGAADFGGITTSTSLFVSAVLHQADVTVDESGTVAAAATAAVVSASAAFAGPGPRPFVADHPFAYVIRDRPTGAVLFAGVVTNPGA